VEFICLIIREFNVRDFNLKYFVGINQIRFDLDYFLNVFDTSNEKELLDQFFKTVDGVQQQFKNSVLQFIKNRYVLNQDHIFIACYFLQKVFYYNLNISNKKKIELLLYLSTNRQISRSIHAFGINSSDLSSGNLLYCIISPINNLNNINDEILKVLKADETELLINIQSNEKFNLIREYFEISEQQIACILNSYGIDKNSLNSNLLSKITALYDLICERMALLNIEKTLR